MKIGISIVIECKRRIGIFILLLLGFTSFAQQEFSRQFDKVFDNITMVNLSHQNGPLQIRASRDNQVKVVAEITFQGQ